MNYFIRALHFRAVVWLTALLLAVPAALADQTHIWNFSVPAQYEVSNPDYIRVTGGRAELIPQARDIYRATLEEYAGPEALMSALGAGTPAYISLRRNAQNEHPADGQFTSRIIRGAPNIEWQYMRFSSAADQHMADSSLLAWYRFDNDGFLDYVSLQRALTHAVSFTTDAIAGGFAAKFNRANESYVQLDRILRSLNELTIALWVKIPNDTANPSRLFMARPPGDIVFLDHRNRAGQVMQVGFKVGGSAASVQNAYNYNEWIFVTGTWNRFADGGRTKIYVNGTLGGTASSGFTSVLANDSYVPRIGQDSQGSGQATDAIIDEFVVWNRALSAEEIQRLYKGYYELYPLRFQVRSGSSTNDILTRSWSGDDGTADTYFLQRQAPLREAEGSFNLQHPFVQYRAFLKSSIDRKVSPIVGTVGMFGTTGMNLDGNDFDFAQGTHLDTVVGGAGLAGRSYLGLGRSPSGGYYQSGEFVSRRIDSGTDDMEWNRLEFTRAGEALDADRHGSQIPGLLGYYKGAAGWLCDAGTPRGGTAVNVGQTGSLDAKLGDRAAIFYGDDSYVHGFGYADLEVRTIEFWLKADADSFPVMTFNNALGRALVVSNRTVQATGYAPAVYPRIYVNGNPHAPKLRNNWNHIALVWLTGTTIPDWTVGRVDGRYFSGLLDDVAVFSIARGPEDIMERYVRGAPEIGGDLRFQVRAFNNPDNPGSFVGPNNNPAAFYTASGNLPFGTNGRYFQYSFLLDGPGDTTPGLISVRVVYVSTNEIIDNSSAVFHEGTFSQPQLNPLWYGAAVRPHDLWILGPPAAIQERFTTQLMSAWHMDNDFWAPGATPAGNPGFVSNARVGTHAGSFDGVAARVSLNNSLLGDDPFSFGLWFLTGSTNRSGLASTLPTAQAQYFSLEINSDGDGGHNEGGVALVASDGAVTRRLISQRRYLNDNRWHHALIVRNANQLLLYIDGALEAAADLAGFGGIDAHPILLAFSHAAGAYAGLLDEAVLFAGALTPGEIGQLAGTGFSTRSRNERQFMGILQGPREDNEEPGIWDAMSWTPGGLYGSTVPGSAAIVAGRWALDETNGVTAVDSSAHGNHGTISGVLINQPGRFGRSIEFDGSGGIEIPNNVGNFAALEPVNFEMAVSAWVYPDAAGDMVIFDKSAGALGYRLGTDEQGRAYFRVRNTRATAALPLRTRTWNHVAGVITPLNELRIYVNGVIVGSANEPDGLAHGGTAAYIGRHAGAGERFAGRIDEVLVFNRALDGAQVQDHYTAGAVSIELQVETQMPGAPRSGFFGPDGTGDTYFTDWHGSDIRGTGKQLGRWLQYKAFLATEDYLHAPVLRGFGIYVSGYPVSAPYVQSLAGAQFPGRLTGFSHVPIFGLERTDVRYQVTGDSLTNNPTWYFWDITEVPPRWKDVNDAWSTDYPHAHSKQTNILEGIVHFYDQLYDKTGGEFNFRAFLESGGDFQMMLDQVSLTYTRGSVTVLFPNGEEVGDNALIAGVPYTIRWSSLGTVSDNLTIELSNNGGITWPITLATGVGNTNEYRTVISEVLGNQYRIRIRDPLDPNIRDTSDGNFEIIQSSRIVVPDGGELWYAGDTNTVVWEYFQMGGVQSGTGALFISPDDGVTWHNVATVPYQSGVNYFDWHTPKQVANYLSETARMGFAPNQYAAAPSTAPDSWDDISNASFIMAGIAITYPAAGDSIKMGNQIDVLYRASHAGEAVKIEFLPGGTEWITLAESVPCVPGNNSFTVVLDSDTPSAAALIRISSLSDEKVTGTSHPFTLADVNIIAPRGSPPGDPDRDRWRIGDEYQIQWTSAGAGDLVKIDYSTDLTNWTEIVTDLPNINSEEVIITNVYDWVVSGPVPSGNGYIRIGSIDQPDLYAITLPFDYWGVRVDNPRGFEVWEFTGTNNIAWTYRTPPHEQADILVAFQGGGPTDTYEMLIPSVLLNTRSINIPPHLIRRPTTLGRIRIKVVGDPMYDSSPNNFVIRGMKMETPAAGAIYTLRQTFNNGLQWYSAATGSGVAELWYSSDNGATYTDRILINNLPQTDNVDGGTSWNTRHWEIPGRLTPSTTARVQVRAGTYRATSPQFVMRGIRITQPHSATLFDLGAQVAVVWQRAALQGAAVAAADLSLTGPAGPFFDAGFPPNVPVGVSHNILWNIPPQLDPTTNAVIRLRVTAPEQDTDVEAFSDSFTLRGLKITRPTGTNNWALGQMQPIHFITAGMGAGARATFQYSANGGVTFDTARPIAQNIEFGAGMNVYNWNIEADKTWTRLPSTNAVIRMISGAAQTVSEPFRMSGIKVTRPIRTDIWAVSDITNTVHWVAVDDPGPYDIIYTRWEGGAPVHTEPIATGVTGNSYEWTMPADSIGTDVTISVQGVNYEGISEVFEIVTEPSIRIISPAPGDFWKVNGSNTIVWSRGGNMHNEFDVFYSAYPFAITNLIGSGTYPPVEGMFSQIWQPIPNEVGPVRLYIVNREDAGINDTFEDFRIAARFEINPFLGDIYARSAQQVSWVTRGTIFGGVTLYYSTDEFRDPGSWVRVNDTPFMEVADNGVSQFTWTVPDVRSDTVWLRVQDADYPAMYPAGQTGPFDDLGMFEIKYYQILWNIRDADTSNHLQNVSVSDSSGWSQSGMNSPVLREYPFGTWDTVWMREFFADKVVFRWNSEPSREIDVFMQKSQIEPDYRVMANFAYITATTNFNIQSWLERGGQIMGTPERNIIKIYDSAGSKIEELTTTNIGQDGVFRQTWDVNATAASHSPPLVLTSTDTFFARVEITFSGVTYSSGLTFQLRQAASDELNLVIDEIRGSTTDILDRVDQVGVDVTNVLGVVSGTHGVLTAFRGEAMGALTNLLDMSVVTTGLLHGVSGDISDMRFDMAGLVTNVQDMTDQMINVMLPAVTDVQDMVTTMADDSISILARILTRPTEIQAGSTNTILYRTRPAYDSSQVSLSVSNAAGTVWGPYHMAEMIGGIYQRSIIADWGIGSYIITATDPSATDSIAVRVVGDDIDAVAGTLRAVSNTLAMVDAELDLLRGDVSGIGLDVVSATNMLDLLDQTVAALRLDVFGIGDDVIAATNLLAVLEQDVGAIGTELIVTTNLLTALGIDLTALGVDVGALGGEMIVTTNLLTALGIDLTALGVDVGALGDELIVTTNLLAALGVDLATLGVDVGALGDEMIVTTNLLAALGIDVTQLIADVAGIAGSDLSGVEQALAALGVDVTQLIADVAGIAGSDLSGVEQSLDELTIAVSGVEGTDLTGITGQLSVIENAISSIEGTDLTGVESNISNIMRMFGSEDDSDDHETVFGRLERLSRQVDEVGSAQAAARNANSAKTQATAAASAARNLQQMMEQQNVDGALDALQGVRGALAEMQRYVEQVPQAAKIGALHEQLKNAAGNIEKLAASHGFEYLVNLQDPDAAVAAPTDPAAPDTDEDIIRVLNRNVEEVRGSMQFMQQMLDEMRHAPVVEETWLSGE